MREQDMTYLLLLWQRQQGSNRTGIQEHCVIDEKCTGLALHHSAMFSHQLIGSVAAEYTDFH